LTGAATISVGSVGLSGEFLAAFGGESSQSVGLGQLIERMEREEFDLIAVGRALISDPAWVNKVQDGELDELKGFTPADLAELV
jgi:2,4-dienoyl-CoA reductase-like NADH-dependent reductase (Old Yellow Enzyme family)